MKVSWLSTRKHIFIRDLYRDFFEAKFFFDSILTTYKKSSSIPFHLLDSWVGNEAQKGPLWRLKDQCHKLYRNPHSQPSLYEHLFDWTVGSIFHESMKLKEDSYQVESYKPLLALEVTENENKKELSKIITEYFSLIEKASKNLKDELNGIDELFTKAVYHLRAMVPVYKNNFLLLRFLLDNKNSIEKIFGRGSFSLILQQIYPEGNNKAYLSAAEHCIKNGWYHEAQDYLKNAIRIDEKNVRTYDLLNEIENKLNKDNTEE